ncbi:MAG: glycoside hydrolase family 88 protein [bacterium]|nr:glycoside hydrolase family 88 protein [bacterium]
MRKIIILLLIVLSGTFNYARAQELPDKKQVMKTMELANGYLMKKWPDPGQTVITNRERPSNLWTRATYYEGLMALYSVNPKKEYYKYALAWAESHQWKFRGREVHTPVIYNRDANVLCAAQTYIELYLFDPQPERIINAKLCADSLINSDKKDDWFWIDALQMAMPVFAKLGAIYNDEKYFDKMHQMYLAAKDEIGGGLYNREEHLWWRDADFLPPYKEPNGEDCYWSRGNGWVYAALVRVLDVLPKDHKYREEYLTTFKEMSAALLKVQRADGYWNVSLHDPDNFGGKELTGTAFFSYGFAWGINNEILDRDKYTEPVIKAWNAMSDESVHENGFLGYVQGTGKEPKDGQPVTYTSKPDFEDYGLGAFLLAGAEVYKFLK